MWRDPGTWIALAVSALLVAAAWVMHRIIVKVLKDGTEPTPKDE